MTAQRDLELRILEGLHQGARAALDPSSQTHTVGKNTDFEIVLRDLPIDSGEIRIVQQSWTWRDPNFEITLPLGEALGLEDLVIQVCESKAPWPESPNDPIRHQRNVRERPSDDTTNDPLEQQGVAAAPEVLSQTELMNEQQSLEPRSVSTTYGRNIGLSIAVVVTVVVVVAGAWVLTMPPDPGSSASKATRLTAESTASTIGEVELKAIAGLIEEKGLSDRVEAILNSSIGRIDIRGVMADDEEFESFVRAVRNVTSRVALRIVSQQDFATDVRGVQQDLPEGVRVSARPIGILEVKGVVNDDQDREELIARIENLVPVATQISIDVRTKSEVAVESRDNQRGGRGAGPTLPEVMAIVGGIEPFLVLKNGDRIMIGGIVSGHTLTQISESHIEYSDSEGKTIRVAR
jgi:hypothetical protein